MELPFYLHYNEFQDHYYYHLEKWFEKHHNTSETDFLKSLAEMYIPFLYYNFANDKVVADASFQIKDCTFPFREKLGLSFCTSCESSKIKEEMHYIFEWKTITMMEYAQHILDKINRYFFKHGISQKNKNVLDYINHYDAITFKEGVGYCINYQHHQKIIPFLRAYLPNYGQTVSINLYRDFISSLGQIADFIDERLKSVQIFEDTIYSKLKSEAKFKVQMSHQFLTLCN